MSNNDIKKLCYDLSLIYAKNSISSLSPDDPYVNKENEKFDYLYGAFEDCYNYLLNKPEDYFKHLS